MPESWPYDPLPDIVETLEWRSDVLSAIDQEQRMALRESPRLMLELRHYMSDTTLATAIAQVRDNIDGTWTVPAWTIPGGANQTAIMTRDLEVQQILPRGAFVRARFMVPIGEGVVATGLTEYNSSPVMADPFQLTPPLSASVGRAISYVDSGLGEVAIEIETDYVSERHVMHLRDVGDSALTARREFFHLIRGRQRKFWIVPRAVRLSLTAAIGSADTEVRITPAGPLAAYVGRHLAIDVAGTPTYREITGSALDGSEHVLTIAATGTDYPITTTLHYMMRVRLDSDAVTMRHSRPIVLTSVPVLEVPT